jgi:hypothetical protein
LTAAVKAEVLPAASRARIWYCDIPLMGWVNEVVGVVATGMNGPPLDARYTS